MIGSKVMDIFETVDCYSILSRINLATLTPRVDVKSVKDPISPPTSPQAIPATVSQMH